MNTHSTNQPTNHPTSQPASALFIHPYIYTNIDEYNIHRHKLTILQLVNGTRSVTVVHAGHRRRTNERTNERALVHYARSRTEIIHSAYYLAGPKLRGCHPRFPDICVRAEQPAYTYTAANLEINGQ